MKWTAILVGPFCTTKGRELLILAGWSNLCSWGHRVCVYGGDCFWLEESCGMLARGNGEFWGGHSRTRQTSTVGTFGLGQMGLGLLGNFHSIGVGNHF